MLMYCKWISLQDCLGCCLRWISTPKVPTGKVRYYHVNKNYFLKTNENVPYRTSPVGTFWIGYSLYCVLSESISIVFLSGISNRNVPRNCCNNVVCVQIVCNERANDLYSLYEHNVVPTYLNNTSMTSGRRRVNVTTTSYERCNDVVWPLQRRRMNVTTTSYDRYNDVVWTLQRRRMNVTTTQAFSFFCSRSIDLSRRHWRNLF